MGGLAAGVRRPASPTWGGMKLQAAMFSGTRAGSGGFARRREPNELTSGYYVR